MGGGKYVKDVITSNNDCFHFQCLGGVMNQVKMKHKLSGKNSK